MSKPRCSVLAVDDEAAILGLLHELLDGEFDLTTAQSAEQAEEALAARPIDIILADQQLPGRSGVSLLEYVCTHYPQVIRVLMTGLGRLEDAVDAINCGRVHRYLFKPWTGGQLVQTLHHAARLALLERSHDQLLEELRRLNLELEQRVQERTRELEIANRLLQQRNSILTKMALTDPLTGLPNRRAMDRLAKTELLRRARYPSPLALGIADADNFKDINSQFLLSGGDHALAWLAHTLGQAVRAVDSIGRVGGEEFMVVAPETDPEGAWILAERMRTAVERGSTQFNGQEMRLTISVGIAVAPKGLPVGYDQLRHVAAAALGEAKATGRNKTVLRIVSPPQAQSAQAV